MEQNLNAFIKYSGLIDQKLEGNRQRLSDVGTKQENLEEKVEKLLKDTDSILFMESAIASINETSNMLGSVFKNGKDD